MVGWEIGNRAERGDGDNTSIRLGVVRVCNGEGGGKGGLKGGDRISLTLNRDGNGVVINVNGECFGGTCAKRTGENERDGGISNSYECFMNVL